MSTKVVKQKIVILNTFRDTDTGSTLDMAIGRLLKLEVLGLVGLGKRLIPYNIMPTLDFLVIVKLSSTRRLLCFTAQLEPFCGLGFA